MSSNDGQCASMLVNDGPKMMTTPAASMSSDQGDMTMKKHPGFAAIQKKMEAQGYTAKQAGAMIASAARNASPAAKKANPRLKQVGNAKKK